MLTSSGRNIDFMIKTVDIAIWLLLLLTVGFTFHLSSKTHFATETDKEFLGFADEGNTQLYSRNSLVPIPFQNETNLA
jgi:hypothetical protein